VPVERKHVQKVRRNGEYLLLEMDYGLSDIRIDNGNNNLTLTN